MALILDAGALIALDRNERSMWIRMKNAHSEHNIPMTHAGVVGQVWRGGPRQARLAQALAGMDVRPLDQGLGRAAGVLLGHVGRSDVIDAALVLMADDGDDIVTSDLADLEPLAAASGTHVELLRP